MAEAELGHLNVRSDAAGGGKVGDGDLRGFRENTFLSREPGWLLSASVPAVGQIFCQGLLLTGRVFRGLLHLQHGDDDGGGDHVE